MNVFVHSVLLGFLESPGFRGRERERKRGRERERLIKEKEKKNLQSNHGKVTLGAWERNAVDRTQRPYRLETGRKENVSSSEKHGRGMKGITVILPGLGNFYVILPGNFTAVILRRNAGVVTILLSPASPAPPPIFPALCSPSGDCYVSCFSVSQQRAKRATQNGDP